MSYRFTSAFGDGDERVSSSDDHRVHDTPAAWLFTVFVWPFVVLALETILLPVYVTFWESVICLRLDYLATILFSKCPCFKRETAENTLVKYKYLSPNNLAKAREPHKRFSGRVAEGDEHLFDPAEIKSFFKTYVHTDVKA